MSSPKSTPVNASPSSDMRQRVNAKDESIRKAAGQSLLKKATNSPGRKAQLSSQSPPTGHQMVASSMAATPTSQPVLTIHEDASVLEACRLMAAKRADAI